MYTITPILDLGDIGNHEAVVHGILDQNNNAHIKNVSVELPEIGFLDVTKLVLRKNHTREWLEGILKYHVLTALRYSDDRPEDWHREDRA